MIEQQWDKVNWPTQTEVLQACEDAELTLDNPGFCLACGEPADGCEPDAREYECVGCGERAVYGASECLLNGWFR